MQNKKMKNIFNFDGQVNGKQFDEEDISLTEAFAIFCGIGISCKLFILQIICMKLYIEKVTIII